MALGLSKSGICLGLSLLLASLSADVAGSAQIVVSPSTETVALVSITGELDFGDAIAFQRKTEQIREAVVVLHSPGGNAAAGISIGRAIRKRGFVTVVPPSVNCASACAWAWLGGVHRLMGERARIGFHAAYLLRGGRARRSAAANATFIDYVSGLDLPPQAVSYITGAPPERMYWLTLATAQAVGIKTSLYAAGGIADLLEQAQHAPMTIQEATDYPGNDIGRLKQTTLDACLVACSGDRTCKAFTFVTYRSECWLKNETGSAEPRNGLVSGIK
jgi:hypothetical protein